MTYTNKGGIYWDYIGIMANKMASAIGELLPGKQL